MAYLWGMPETKPFIHEDFLLDTEAARQLYHGYAAQQPIIDYHCHLPPDQLAADQVFPTITAIWLNGDHYKWRAMRTNGVNESYITGPKTDWEKFEQWAATVPDTMRNPLYHWTHMELANPFGITELLNPGSARRIYDATTAQISQPSMSVRNLLRHFHVQVVCTTDDPIDSLEHHAKLQADGFEVKVLPTFRPDKAMEPSDATAFNAYVDRVAQAANQAISTLEEYLSALRQRHDHFAALGCQLSDHGLETVYAADYTLTEVSRIFSKVRCGYSLTATEILQFKSYMLVFFAELDHEKGWTQQFHLGALRNNNPRMMRTLGPDTGFDSIGDFQQAVPLAKFLARLDSNDRLAKTIIYNLNPADNEVFATMIGNFNDGSIAGKIQYGSGWWFLDQLDGMERQINALSNMGLLARFIGMLTDSRSFLSYPRHDYFRRLLCRILGREVAQGLLPNDIAWLGNHVANISYHNAKGYFGF